MNESGALESVSFAVGIANAGTPLYGNDRRLYLLKIQPDKSKLGPANAVPVRSAAGFWGGGPLPRQSSHWGEAKCPTLV